MRFVLISFCVASSVLASGTYPGDIATALAVTAPACTLCHVGAPGFGTATSKFAVSAKGKGLMGGGATALLTTALTALETSMTDSDGDGVPDITELKTGKNPNVKDAVVVMPDAGIMDGGVVDGGMGGGTAGGGSEMGGGTGGGDPPPAIYGCGGASVVPFGLAIFAVALWRRRSFS
jgi:hypothetical protein